MNLFLRAILLFLYRHMTPDARDVFVGRLSPRLRRTFDASLFAAPRPHPRRSKVVSFALFRLRAVMVPSRHAHAIAAAADRATTVQDVGLIAYPVYTATTIYKGTMVCLNSSGYAVPAANTSGYSNVLGLAYEQVVNAGASGAKSIRVQSNITADLAATGITQAMVGTEMYVVYDNEFDNSAGNGIRAGILVKFISTTRGVLLIRNPATTPGSIATSDITAANITTALLADNNVTAGKLTATLRTGTIDLPLTSWRITDNANTNFGLVAATALIGSGGVGGIDGEPSLTRVNAATDKTARIVWLDAKLDPILNDFTIPADADVTAAFTFKALVAMSGTNNATSILTLTWVAVAAGAYAAGADQGGATSAIADATLVAKPVTIAAAAINAPGSHVSVSLTPTSPGTDAMHLYATWVEYTRK